MTLYSAQILDTIDFFRNYSKLTTLALKGWPKRTSQWRLNFSSTLRDGSEQCSQMTCGKGPQPVGNRGISEPSLRVLEKFKRHSVVLHSVVLFFLYIKYNCAALFLRWIYWLYIVVLPSMLLLNLLQRINKKAVISSAKLEEFSFTLTLKTRWYPRGIQKLVSTYRLPETPGKRVVLQTNSNPKSQDLPKLSFLEGGCTPDSNSKCQDLPKLSFLEGVYSRLKLKVPRSAQIIIFGGGVLQTNSKCQDLPKFSFLEGEGVLQTNSNSKCQDLPKYSFLWGWGGGGGGGSGLYSRLTFLKYLSGDTQGILNQNFWQLECVVHHK